MKRFYCLKPDVRFYAHKNEKKERGRRERNDITV
jgi:hypothetical protein